jgi:hypothetical protein
MEERSPVEGWGDKRDDKSGVARDLRREKEHVTWEGGDCRMQRE